MERIKYNKNMIIRNINQLSHGTGAKYLEVMKSHEKGVYIAAKWHKKLVKIPSDHVLVVF